MAGGHVDRVDVETSRRDVSGALFKGWDPKDALLRMSQIFSLCGTAQTVAACMAAESAQGVAADAAVVAARDVLRLSEMITQTAMRLCLHWPKALNMHPLPGPVQASMAVQRSASRVFAGALTGPASADQDISGLWPQIDALGAAIAVLQQPDGLHQQLRHELARLGWQGVGALPNNSCPEQGALTRRWNEPAVAAARHAFGAGLMARLEAGFCDFALLLDEMRAALTRVDGTVAAPDLPDIDGTGQASVETARGALGHKVSIHQGRIETYRITAPTEVNFADGGPVAAGLLGADADGIETAARLHVLAMDPCVDATIGLDHA